MSNKSKQEQKEKAIGITAKKADDMAEWYGQVCLKSELAEYSPVKGCMIIRPLGYAVWEAIQGYFNKRLRSLRVQNAYFPLFIPESFFQKEATHAQGFKPEVAWIANKMEGERLAIRPTSETIIYDSFARWGGSHRDLPIRINQWCNVVRWETEATKLFLRSREFLWQEGHCAYETEEDCDRETLLMLSEYEALCRNMLAFPVMTGKKTENQKFAGAKYTTTIEAFMPDGKALQCGTSHNLGQNFAKSFGISFTGRDEKIHLPWQSSWGVSTRLIGAVVMTHGDDKGLVFPPFIAPIQVVIVPILFDATTAKVLDKARDIFKRLDENYRVVLDDRDEHTPGWKYAEWELKGAALRLEIGPRDVEKEQVVLVRRDTGEKISVAIKELDKRLPEIMKSMNDAMYKKAKAFLDESVVPVKGWSDFLAAIKDNKMALAPWCGKQDCETAIKEKTEGVTSRCIPFDQKKVSGKCFHCGNSAMYLVCFSRAY